MRIFTCKQCGQLVYFENIYCENCNHSLGFDIETMDICTLVPTENGQFALVNQPELSYRYCSNYEHKVCNWLVPAHSVEKLCAACELNDTIPNLVNTTYLEQWRLLEYAKHRLIYSLVKLHLPFPNKKQEPVTGLAFNFLAAENRNEKVLTGHENGLITINIAEADDVVREQSRKNMNEPYRTLLGHFRHEIGHYYWDKLIANTAYLHTFRQLFGNEELDYTQALETYYQQGPPASWPNHISAYASSHPWEDWAETWAHYLHTMDTLETAYAFGLHIMPGIANPSLNVAANMNIDPYQLQNFEDIISRWLPFTYAMNSINRSMGQKDLYPFVMSEVVMKKLAFIHQVCQGR